MRFVASFDEDTPVSIRTNPWKALPQCGMVTTQDAVSVPWCRRAWWLSERPSFTLDPLLHGGAYYVQEAGSMFLDNVLQTVLPTLPEDILALDLCAAPGGKSTLLRAALSENSWLIANEPDRKRANILMENLQKQGHPRVTVTNGYARDFQRSRLMFDLIVCDVPCSGEGMFRKDEGAIREWSLANVHKCAELQRSIVEDIWSCLAPGGVLVYSTCTFNTREDEENVRWILDTFDAGLVAVPTEAEWGIQGSLLAGFDAPVYRFIPGTTRSEGLFMAVIRKSGQLKDNHRDVMPSQKQLSKLRLLHHGIPTGEQKGKDFIPDHALALSLALPDNRYPRVPLCRDDALRYLHREAIALPPDTPRGYVLVCYEGIPLGFMKNIGNRANNLYPKEWAIYNLKQ